MFQITLGLRDEGTPPGIGQNRTLVFNIIRNLQGPVFRDLIDGVYVQTVDAFEAVGSIVENVRATDSDTDVRIVYT